jgi:hypothetical protein
VVVALAGALPLLATGYYRSFGQTRSDDWAYLQSLASLTQHGTIDFHHWGAIFELGQFLLVAPIYLVFGVHPVLAELWVWAVGMAGLLGLTYLGRRCGAPRGVMVLLVATMALCPLFLKLDISFMTDVPAFSCMILALCLWVGCRNMSSFEPRRWAAFAVATFAFTIREPAVLVALPIVLEPLLNARRSGNRQRTRRSLTWIAVWVAMLGALWIWRQGIPSSGWEPPVRLTPVPFLQPWLTGWLPAMVGLFLLPVLLTLSPWDLVPPLVRRHRRAAQVITALALVIPLTGGILSAVRNPQGLQLGNYDAVAPYMPLLLRAVLFVIGLLSLTTTLLILLGGCRPVAAMTTRDQRTVRGLGAVLIGYSGFILGARLFGIYIWDRYWLVVIALTAIVLCRAGAIVRRATASAPTRPSLRRWSIGVAMSLVAVFGAAAYTETVALFAGSSAFADRAASQLPPGYRAADINSLWNWNLSLYAADPGAYTASTQDGVHQLRSKDAAGSTIFIDRTRTGTCGPWTVWPVADGQAIPPGALLVSPVSHALFVSFRFALVHRPPAGCTDTNHRYVAQQ